MEAKGMTRRRITKKDVRRSRSNYPRGVPSQKTLHSRLPSPSSQKTPMSIPSSMRNRSRQGPWQSMVRLKRFKMPPPQHTPIPRRASRV
ncbi:hypothetical protein C8T65DRAFT_634041 [Cerioporus squamosus]|nr:hypothetical protein C8T65DRAFT_634041 [Cerioporus squamosus]